jgi:hypothetical protein
VPNSIDDGKKDYEIQQTIQPGDQMWLNLADLIHHSAPDRKGNALPADVASGTYDLEDLNPGRGGNLIEGKVALDKTFGHLTYGCLTCCGYSPYLSPNPTGLGVGGDGGISAFGTNNCTGASGFSLYSYFNQSTAHWWSGNTSTATVTSFKGHGVAPGTTYGFATATVPSGDGNVPKSPCPQLTQEGDNNVTVRPTITSFDPNPIMIGVSNTTLTINGSGFGTSPTVNLPSGITSTGQGSTDTQIVLQGVNVALSAMVGNNNVTVTAGGQPSAPASLTVDGPYQMVVQSDLMGLCSGCKTTVLRTVTYQVQNFSGVPANATWMGESVSLSGWSCTQSNPGFRSSPCSANFFTNSAGVFSDQWSLASDVYTPTGCGENVTDHWQWCAHNSAQTLGTLAGYTHTNAISINGVVNPPNSMPPGTVIPF